MIRKFLRWWLGIDYLQVRIIRLARDVAALDDDCDYDDDDDWNEDDECGCGCDTIIQYRTPEHLDWLIDVLDECGLTEFHIDNMSLDLERRIRDALMEALKP